MDYRKFQKAKLQKKFNKKKYLADLDYWGIKSRDIDDIIRELLKIDMAGHEELHDFPIWELIENEESQQYLHLVVPELIKKIKGPKISIKVDYGGKSMYQFFFLADMLDEDSIPDLLDNISDEIAFLTDASFWHIACEEDEAGHKAAKNLLLDFTSGFEKHKILQKLKFAASVVGRKIVDKALSMSDNLTIKEMETVLKGKAQFLTTYYDEAEIHFNI